MCAAKAKQRALTAKGMASHGQKKERLRSRQALNFDVRQYRRTSSQINSSNGLQRTSRDVTHQPQ